MTKFYAVKQGRIPGIYQTWEETKKQVIGYSDAIYKSFSTFSEAEQFILGEIQKDDRTDLNAAIEEKIVALTDDEVIAFVDGSYHPDYEKCGFGAIIIGKNGEKYTSYKAYSKHYSEELLALKNVAAELEGVKEVVEVAIGSKKNKITIYYDYEGIEKWATNQWKANKKLTQQYVSFMQEKSRYINIEFVKVPAHSGIIYNEEADALAKMSLLAKGHKTYKDGSVYFVGYSKDDWVTIVEYINDENRKSLENEGRHIQIIEKYINNTRTQLIIENFNDKVSINIYHNSKSYVQGKQSVLFQRLISTAVEFLSNKQNVVETLNSYHALTIKKEEVEVYFNKLLPDYKGNYNDKIYYNLLSATYNLMLTGYMPDYTCLVTPIFRAYEYYLHKILGEKMGLMTERENGTNNFAYFMINRDGHYECSSLAKYLLTVDQLEFLNTFYENYNAIRHPYSHWSANEYGTVMIDDMNKVRRLINEGLNLINKYYTLF